VSPLTLQALNIYGYSSGMDRAFCRFMVSKYALLMVTVMSVLSVGGEARASASGGVRALPPKTTSNRGHTQKSAPVPTRVGNRSAATPGEGSKLSAKIAKRTGETRSKMAPAKKSVPTFRFESGKLFDSSGKPVFNHGVVKLGGQHPWVVVRLGAMETLTHLQTGEQIRLGHDFRQIDSRTVISVRGNEVLVHDLKEGKHISVEAWQARTGGKIDRFINRIEPGFSVATQRVVTRPRIDVIDPHQW